ncbi:hypothetical protein AWQ21_10840 [Picosynechococcus sp. PCC 7003]|uniref:Uma2 family endonuclease n=1 Tax=Picosynechococcus sp. PCC 7003 TaxID=374981 RepID=UPI000810BA49|nr:Uma2 family endonuclease [Picosynechococcus sp. PCC 7003]ANV84830.1 hypothetical protein AWQ21_10840 [Picosynechococcus sp. PCC 7003]
MIATPKFPEKMTAAEYLQWEERQELRYEYINGEIIARAGGTLPHNDIALNFYSLLRPHLKKRGCRVNVSDVKVQGKANRRYFYPDLVVSCHPEDLKARKWIQYPKVIVEVLSPSTSNYDSKEKLKYYRQIPSLEEYILLDSEHIYVDLYQRQTGEMWGYRDFGVDDTLVIPSLNFECAVADIYVDVTLAAEDKI